MSELTKMQRRLLRYIATHVDRYGFQPSMREIADQFGLRSASGIMAHMRRLEAKGIVRCAGSARSIEFDWRKYI